MDSPPGLREHVRERLLPEEAEALQVRKEDVAEGRRAKGGRRRLLQQQLGELQRQRVAALQLLLQRPQKVPVGHEGEPGPQPGARRGCRSRRRRLAGVSGAAPHVATSLRPGARSPPKAGAPLLVQPPVLYQQPHVLGAAASSSSQNGLENL